MSQVVTLELRDDVYAALRQQAESVGVSLPEWLAAALERQSGLSGRSRTETEKEEARQRFRRHAGAIDLGHATGADNQKIDADLIRAYDGDVD